MADEHIARIRFSSSVASGRRESWAKTVTDIDTTERGARAFEGEYLQDGVECDLFIGQFVIEVIPQGSVKNGWQSVRMLRVTADGLETVDDDLGDWRKDFLSIRDTFAAALEKSRSEQTVNPVQTSFADVPLNTVVKIRAANATDSLADVIGVSAAHDYVVVREQETGHLRLVTDRAALEVIS